MSTVDYRLCDVCGHKCFYDANLNYDFDDETGKVTLDHVGEMKVICNRCSKDYQVLIEKRVKK